MQKWKKGSGVLLYGTFVMFLAMTMCLFFIQTFYLQQKHQDAQTAADSIADATAVYAATQSSDYDDVTAHAGEVQQKVAEQTGVTTTDLQIDRDKLENDSQVAVSLGLPGTYQSGIAIGRNFGQTSSFMAKAGAVTEFTGLTGSTDIVQVALSQEGITGGQPFWSWYGFPSRVEWCACFVSWCANQCGYIDNGIIPRYSYCPAGVDWFRSHNEFVSNNTIPQPGYIVFFDWNRDGISDHTGIVVETMNNITVHTIEGNSGDCVRQRYYPVGSPSILGYGTPAY